MKYSFIFLINLLLISAVQLSTNAVGISGSSYYLKRDDSNQSKKLQEKSQFESFDAKYKDCFNLIKSFTIDGRFDKSKFLSSYSTAYKKILELEELRSFWIEKELYHKIVKVHRFYEDYSRAVVNMKVSLDWKNQNSNDETNDKHIEMLETFFELVHFSDYKGSLDNLDVWMKQRLKFLLKLEAYETYHQTTKEDGKETAVLFREALKKVKKYFMAADLLFSKAMKMDQMYSTWKKDVEFFKFEEQYVRLYEAMRGMFTKSRFDMQKFLKEATYIAKIYKSILASTKRWQSDQRYSDISYEIQFFTRFAHSYQQLMITYMRLKRETNKQEKVKIQRLFDAISLQLTFINFYDHFGRPLYDSKCWNSMQQSIQAEIETIKNCSTPKSELATELDQLIDLYQDTSSKYSGKRFAN